MHATTQERAHLRAAEGGHVRTAVTALLPAHNEEAGIGAAIASLRAQTEPPGEIIVVADNCTDRTEQIAHDLGVTVFPTEGNVHKKAGALKASMFYAGKKAHDKDDRVIYDKKTGSLYYDADGTGKSKAVKFATVKKGTFIDHHDFLVI